jgi:hypothetical protein
LTITSKGIAGRDDAADSRRETAAINGDLDHVTRLDRPHVAQRHEQTDLERVGIDQARHDLAARDFLAGPSDMV